MSRKRIVFIVLFTCMFIVLALFQQVDFFQKADESLGASIRDLRSESLNKIMLSAAALGSGKTLIIVLIAAAVLFGWKSRRIGPVLTLLISFAGAYGIGTLLKGIFAKERPNVEQLIDVSGYSFPSSTSLLAFVLYGSIAWIVIVLYQLHRKGSMIVWAVALVVIALVGFSRIYVGAHTPGDVLAGCAAGGAWLTIGHALLLKGPKYSNTKR